mgnify:CR=1 FL=1
MESVIQVNDGSKFKPSNCFFCSKPANKVIGIINIEADRYNGQVFKGFHVCDKHITALNRILDGSKDINDLVEHYENLHTGNNFNLRANL